MTRSNSILFMFYVLQTGNRCTCVWALRILEILKITMTYCRCRRVVFLNWSAYYAGRTRITPFEIVYRVFSKRLQFYKIIFFISVDCPMVNTVSFLSFTVNTKISCNTNNVRTEECRRCCAGGNIFITIGKSSGTIIERHYAKYIY